MAPAIRTTKKSAVEKPDVLMLMDSPRLFGKWFTPKESWFPWKVVLAAAFGLPPERTGDEKAARKLFEEFAGRTNWPKTQADTFAVIAGVRSGKSRMGALVATYLCCLRGYEKFLAPGERGVLPVIAADRKQARVVFNYASSFVSQSELFKNLLSADPLKERLSFAHNVDLEIMTASFRSSRGFALALGTPIPTPTGFKALETVHVGDLIFDEAGKPTRVTGVFERVPEKAFRVSFDDGSTIDADAEHRWMTWDFRSRNSYDRHGLIRHIGAVPPNWPSWCSRQALVAQPLGRPMSDFGPKVRTTLEISESIDTKHLPSLPGRERLKNHTIPNCGALQLEERALPLDPYILGLWIGDGATADGVISSNPSNGDMVWCMAAMLAKGFTTKRHGQWSFGVRGLKMKLREVGVLGNKNIPEMYLWASASQRLELLRGLMDSDGTCSKGSRKVEFTSIRKDHADAVVFLARSLGQKPTIKHKIQSGGYAKGRPYINVRWCSSVNVFNLPRKSRRWEEAATRASRHTVSRTIVACTPIPPTPMRCLTVDSPNSMYLCGTNLVPTHNTNIGAVLDELAYYHNDESSGAPDSEIVQSVRRGMLTIPESMLVMISSPYARRGVLWDTYQKHFKVEDSSTFVVQAPTWIMNPTISRESLQSEYDRDPQKADADYGANFRKDVERYVDWDTIEACTGSYVEIAPRSDVAYAAFVDPSGGSQDSFCAAIGHQENREGTSTVDGETKEPHVVVIDAVREWQPPFSPDSVIEEIAAFVGSYGLSSVTGDRYGGDFPAERFLAHGIQYDICKKSKSELYRDMLPLLNSRRITLPNNTRLKQQIWSLERRTTGAGKDSIDHPSGAHDDLSNCAAGACALLREYVDMGLVW